MRKLYIKPTVFSIEMDKDICDFGAAISGYANSGDAMAKPTRPSSRMLSRKETNTEEDIDDIDILDDNDTWGFSF